MENDTDPKKSHHSKDDCNAELIKTYKGQTCSEKYAQKSVGKES